MGRLKNNCKFWTLPKIWPKKLIPRTLINSTFITLKLNKPLKHLFLGQNNETAEILPYRFVVELNKLLKHLSQAQNYKTGEILLYRLMKPEQPNLGTAPLIKWQIWNFPLFSLGKAPVNSMAFSYYFRPQNFEVKKQGYPLCIW